MALIVLDYLRLILSWPVVVGIVAGCFLFTFRAEIRGLLQRIASVKFPGFEMITPQAGVPEPIAPAQTPATNEPNVNMLHLNESEQQRLKSWLDAERLAAKLWEFQFLNYYLALATQHVLNWLVAMPHDTTVGAFDAQWTQYLPNPHERTAILNALAAHGLIEIEGQVMHATAKGRDYASWPERKCMGYAMPPGGPIFMANVKPT